MTGRLPHSMRRLIAGAAALSASRSINMISRLVYLVIVTRWLGPDLFGLLAYAQSWYILFLPLTTLGLNMLLPREVGSRGEGARETLGLAAGLMLASTLLAALVCGGAALVVETEPELQLTMAVFAAALLFRGLRQGGEILFIARERAHLSLLPALLIRPLEPVLAIAALVAGAGLVELAALHAVLWGLELVIVLIVAARRGLLPKPHGLDGRAGRLLLAALPLMLGTVVTTQVSQGTILLYRWVGGPELGQVSLLAQVIIVLAVVPRSVQLSLLPALSRRAAADPAHARAVGCFLVGTSLVGAAALALLARPLAPLVVVPLLGEAYRPAAEGVWLSLALLGFFAAALSLNQQLIARGRYWTVLLSVGIGGVTQVAAFLLLAPAAAADAVLVGGLGFIAWALAAALNSGLETSMLRAVAAAAAGLAAPFVIGDPWLGTLAGLAVLAALTWVLNVVVIPRATVAPGKA